jgi:hypothetical protein
MAVLSLREVSGRTFSHRFGEAPTAERKFVLTLDNTAPTTQEALNAVGIFHGSPHPEYPFLICTDGQVTEGTPSPFHCEITYSYGLPDSGSRDFQANPLARPDVWSFSTGGSAVPALFYWNGDTQEPIVNSAGEVIEGLTTDEAECRATITANRAVFPLDVAIAVTNTVNNATYLGAPAHHWKCFGIAGQQQSEMVNGVEINYWAITSELVYRQTGWNLQLPDVGYNYLLAGKLERCKVLLDGQFVASPQKMALDSDGSQKVPENALPDLLVRRVNREVNFATYFGTPSWF